MSERDFFARIWGARGSLPATGGKGSEFGCNSPCVEVRCGTRILVLDAGSGIFPLGHKLIEQERGEVDLLFSHCHYDHIEGLPFFRPLYSCEWNVRIWSGHMAGRMSTAEIVSGYMREPYFPVGPSCFAAKLSCRDFKPGDVIDAGDGITIQTGLLNHPGGDVGYRIEYDGKAICYITDTEHVPGLPDRIVLSMIEGADVVIYDSSYSDEHFEERRGFGHSTWQEGARLCDAAGAEQLVAFHHLPENDDRALEKVEAALRRMRPGSLLAREGMVIVPGKPVR